MRSLPYGAYLEAVRATLEAAGYHGVRVLRKGSSRNADGGVDIAGDASAGLATVRFAAQAKRGASPVQKRYVDELRGAAARLGAGHGVLVSTAGFSPSAVEAANACAAVPILLLDGRALASLMAANGVDEKQFRDTYNSFSVNANTKRAAQLADQYKIEGVPTVVVQGKYTTSPADAGSNVGAAQTLDYLVDQVRNRKM